MKDIDGQEIQIGDVVLDGWTNAIGKIESLDLAGKAVYVKSQNSKHNIYRGIEEIFCLFYRKPIVVKSDIVYWQWVANECIYPLHKVDNGIHYVWHDIGWAIYYDGTEMPSESCWEQITEQQAKALRPDAFK